MKPLRKNRTFQPLCYSGKSKKWARRRNKEYHRYYLKHCGPLLPGEIGVWRGFRVLSAG